MFKQLCNGRTDFQRLRISRHFGLVVQRRLGWYCQRFSDAAESFNTDEPSAGLDPRARGDLGSNS